MQTSPNFDFIYDGHGHSLASDGSNTPEEILDAAIQKNIQIIGLSDHNTVASLPHFIAYAQKLTSQGHQILAIPSLEQSTLEGDVILLTPNLEDAQRFIQEYRKPTSRPHLIDCIENHIRKYNGLIILPHPQCRLISSVTIDSLTHLITKQLPARYLPHIGIEVYNWMSQIFFWERPAIEKKLRKLARTYFLAQTGGTDYHSTTVIGKGRTIMHMPSLTAESFIEAFKSRAMSVEPPLPSNFETLSSLVTESTRAEINSRYRNPGFRIPH